MILCLTADEGAALYLGVRIRIRVRVRTRASEGAKPVLLLG